ncbi:MAG TPA: hypothetical protein VJM46_04130, partial [Candidatus Saccharimonadales bacterium]|nr:hypothetical protein [Candidatus Saccharimonadales bacterium]
MLMATRPEQNTIEVVRMAIVIAALAGVLAALLATKGKKGLAIVLSIISAVSLFIAFPDILQPDFVNLGQYGNIIAGLIGVILALSAVAAKKMPTAFLLVGILIAMWALCRLVPTVPPAFAHLAPELGKGGEIIWDASVA